MKDFRNAVTDDRVYVFDGAMGTMLYARGVYINRCYDELNLTNADLVLGVQREYVKAGADIIETNSYGANRVKLTGYGLQDKIYDINAAADRRTRRWMGMIALLGIACLRFVLVRRSARFCGLHRPTLRGGP